MISAIIAGAICSLLVVLLAGGAITGIRGKRTTERQFDSIGKSVPDELAIGVTKLRDSWTEHKEAGSNIVGVKLEEIVKNVAELSRRVEIKGSPDQKMIVSVRYADSFDKLSQLLGKSYYLDIRDNGNLWEDPDKRMGVIHTALDDVNTQILRNIRQLNESQDLEFRVALESLSDNNSNGIKSVYGSNPHE